MKQYEKFAGLVGHSNEFVINIPCISTHLKHRIKAEKADAAEVRKYIAEIVSSNFSFIPGTKIVPDIGCNVEVQCSKNIFGLTLGGPDEDNELVTLKFKKTGEGLAMGNRLADLILAEVSKVGALLQQALDVEHVDRFSFSDNSGEISGYCDIPNNFVPENSRKIPFELGGLR